MNRKTNDIYVEEENRLIMKKKFDNRFLVTIFAMLAPVINFIKRHIHLRDVMAFVLGALTMIVGMRLVQDDFCPYDIENPPIDISYSEPVINEEAENIARVLYGVKDFHLSTNAKLAIIETIFSRVECSYGEFGDTVNEVCLKPYQWQGFVEGSSYLREDYDLAESYINGNRAARVTPEGCYWFVVSSDGVTVRTAFDGGNEWTVK